MSSTILAGGSYTLAPDLILNRMGYGAMQLAGPQVFGPPRDRVEAVAVLHEVIALGINHIDTSDFYGPHVTNQIIKEALHPYPEDLRLVTKVGYRRDDTGNWLPAKSAGELRQAVEDNLRNLGLERLDVVNLRLGGFTPEPGSLAEPFAVMVQMQREGLIRHLGLSTVTAEQIAEAQEMAPIVCVQNHYNIAHRGDDALIDSLHEQGIAYVPYFPLGGFQPFHSEMLERVAARLGSSGRSVALAWLLQRSPNVLLIPGTSSLRHLHDNVAAARLQLSAEDVAELNGVAV